MDRAVRMVVKSLVVMHNRGNGDDGGGGGHGDEVI